MQLDITADSFQCTVLYLSSSPLSLSVPNQSIAAGWIVLAD